MIPAYVINLGRRPDRLKLVSYRFAALNVPIQGFNAVDSQELSSVDSGPRVDKSLGIKACWLSHSKLADQIADGDHEYALVLEDDAKPDSNVNWPLLLERLPNEMSTSNLGYLQLGFISNFYRWTRTGVRDNISTIFRRNQQKQLRLDVPRIAIFGSSRAGAHAYVVSRDFSRQFHEVRQRFEGGADQFLDQLAQKRKKIDSPPFMGRLRYSIVEQESRINRRAVLDSDIE